MAIGRFLIRSDNHFPKIPYLSNVSEDQPKDPNKTASRSVRLKNSDWNYLDQVAKKRGIPRNDLFVKLIEVLKIMERDRGKQ